MKMGKNNMKTFAGIDLKYATEESASIILQSIPYDGTSTWGKGADKGFHAFLEAAENMELYDIETGSEVYKRGIYINKEWNNFKNPKQMFERVYKGTQKLLKSNKFLTFFGGEHSVSIGIIKAFYEHYDNITVLQLDAHADLRPEYEGSPYNHACAVFDASLKTNLIQVGIRSMDITEKKFMDVNKVFFADEINYSSDWIDTCIGQLTENVYITLDLDVLDPSIMPATGTPEPGGLDWYKLTNFLLSVFENKNVVGFDIVELAPIKGLSSPQYLTAKLYYKMLSYKFLDYGQ
jgi:agmatinase